MPFLVGADVPPSPAGERFRALLNRREILPIPGAHTGMASLLAKRAGFEAVYVGGSAMTGTMGLPDLGIITVEEVCFFIRQVARASGGEVSASTTLSTALIRLGSQLIHDHKKKLQLCSGSGSAGPANRSAYSAGYAAGGRVDIHGARTSRMLR
jgi:hypothetical protein